MSHFLLVVKLVTTGCRKWCPSSLCWKTDTSGATIPTRKTALTRPWSHTKVQKNPYTCIRMRELHQPRSVSGPSSFRALDIHVIYARMTYDPAEESFSLGVKDQKEEGFGPRPLQLLCRHVKKKSHQATCHATCFMCRTCEHAKERRAFSHVCVLLYSCVWNGGPPRLEASSKMYIQTRACIQGNTIHVLTSHSPVYTRLSCIAFIILRAGHGNQR